MCNFCAQPLSSGTISFLLPIIHWSTNCPILTLYQQCTAVAECHKCATLCSSQHQPITGRIWAPAGAVLVLVRHRCSIILWSPGQKYEWGHGEKAFWGGEKWGEGREGMDGRRQDRWNSAPLDLKPPCRAFWCYTKAVNSMATKRFLQNQVTPLWGCFPYLGEEDERSHQWPFQHYRSPGPVDNIGLADHVFQSTAYPKDLILWHCLSCLSSLNRDRVQQLHIHHLLFKLQNHTTNTPHFQKYISLEGVTWKQIKTLSSIC